MHCPRPSRPTVRQRMTKRPAVALVLVLSLLSTAFVFQAPAAGATHASFTGQESVRAGLSGSLCLDTGEGRVTSSVPALNGDVTVRSRSFTNHLGYGFVFGKNNAALVRRR